LKTTRIAPITFWNCPWVTFGIVEPFQARRSEPSIRRSTRYRSCVLTRRIRGYIDARSGSPCYALISPRFGATDECDHCRQTEGFDLAFDGLKAAPQMGRDASGAKLRAVAQQL
jgi:hypothetical protein